MNTTIQTPHNHNGDHTVATIHTDRAAHTAHSGHEDVSAAAAPRRPEERRRTGRRAWLFLAVVGIGAVGAAAASTWPRLGVHAALAQTTRRIDQGRRSVTVVSPSPAKPLADVRLPGSTSALQETVIYARTSGYIASLKVDIGDHVKAGQLLATIASPEVDQQLNEARARRDEGYANLALAEARLKRLKEVTLSGAVSAQDFDDAQAVYNSRLAAQRVSDNVVSRLETDQSYQKVVAPFDGVVSKRNIDVGALITAGSGTNISSLFELQQQTTMRVFIDVPQSWAASITPGTMASVELREFPNEHFAAKVVRTSSALDPSTRTLRTELHLPNSDGRLMPGMYAQVKLSLDNARGALVVPTSTLVIDSAGVGVVTVKPDHRLARTPIKLGRDFGREVEVVSGLTADARLVVSPRDDLADGEEVVVVEPAKAAVASR
jgi:membrane fusion protein, multidrug efflux system